ncbi:MAG: ATP-binding protein [Magnetococcales bacterium]|nr:ATP-binding protein [Magnetococcales bacterium]
MPKLRVRARAVDMLGRQQIAGIPTALHELFKNAHDAYAERVEVDYYRSRRLLVIRDDGLGMTREEVENRWLTLGTESRLGANDPTQHPWTGPKGLKRRVLMGEKGIGRLAVAVIAPLTLLISRPIRPQGASDTVVALVHWGLFEQPTLDVQQIHVPVKTLPGGTMPDQNTLREMIREIEENLDALHAELGTGVMETLQAPLERLGTIDLSKIALTVTKNRSDALDLRGECHGTWFICLPTAPELDRDIDDQRDKSETALKKLLLGFANTMDPSHPPVITTAFRDHRPDGEIEDHITGKQFFDVDDFDEADHLLDGAFDATGQFNGIIRFYRGEPIPFVCNWTEGKGAPIRCGPFRFRVAYVMGNTDETRLTKDRHQWMTERLNRIGGLYVYRDGIRVLPYGTWDLDWLSIEHRRSRSASDWFWTHRRMFGYVAIGHAENVMLTEKAGREGFRENLAYRDFRAVLENLFTQSAIRFFRDSSQDGEEVREKKAELKQSFALAEKLSQRAETRRKAFQNDLRTFRTRTEKSEFQKISDQLLSRFTQRLDEAEKITQPEVFTEALTRIEQTFHNELGAINRAMTLTKPRGLALGKLETEWNLYLRLLPEIRATTVERVEREVGQRISQLSSTRLQEFQRREAALERLSKNRQWALNDVNKQRKQTLGAAEAFQEGVRRMLREEGIRLRGSIESLLNDFSRQFAVETTGMEQQLGEMEKRIIALHREGVDLLQALRVQLEDLTEGLQARETVGDGMAAIEAKLVRLEEQIDFQSPFVQIGMTVNILGHEFEKAATNVRRAMAELKPWADANPGLRDIHRRLHQSFDYLDGYLKLLDPLGRPLRSRRITISGWDVFTYVNRVFEPILKERNIRLHTTAAFDRLQIHCRDASLFGAVTNLVDNATHWVMSSREAEKRITLDADDRGLLVVNNGPGISAFDAEHIFEYGWTTRAGGRGLGLPVSRDVLAREGLELELLTTGADQHPTFRIAPRPDAHAKDEENERNR